MLWRDWADWRELEGMLAKEEEDMWADWGWWPGGGGCGFWLGGGEGVGGAAYFFVALESLEVFFVSWRK